jgi:HNH endonuclease
MTFIDHLCLPGQSLIYKGSIAAGTKRPDVGSGEDAQRLELGRKPHPALWMANAAMISPIHPFRLNPGYSVALERRSYTQAEEIALTTQVEGCCPLCGAPLFYKKKGRTYRFYELAHIFPLNPKPVEEEELTDVELLSADRNDLENLIPLCTGCHTRFDKPRARAEYDELFRIKRGLNERERQRALMREYPIEDGIHQIVAALGNVSFDGTVDQDLSLDPKSVDTKCKSALPELIIRKIKRNVTDYYPHVQREFRALEQEFPTKSQLIYSQVRTFYLKQRDLGVPKTEIYQNVVAWFRNASKTDMIEAPEVIAAFFVQNCEVLD